MYSNSKGKVELAAYVLENGGVEILPWNKNNQGQSYPYPPDPNNKNARVQKVKFGKGQPILVYNDGTTKKAVAYIHTHTLGTGLSDADVANLSIISVPNYTLSTNTYIKDTYWGYNGVDYGFLQVNGKAIQNTQVLSGFSIYSHAKSIINKK